MNDNEPTRPGGLIAWQWNTYPDNHRERVNLVLHFFAVPAFIASALVVVTGVVGTQARMVLVGLIGIVVPLVKEDE